jgi:hypothetical protein
MEIISYSHLYIEGKHNILNPNFFMPKTSLEKKKHDSLKHHRYFYWHTRQTFDVRLTFDCRFSLSYLGSSDHLHQQFAPFVRTIVSSKTKDGQVNVYAEKRLNPQHVFLYIYIYYYYYYYVTNHVNIMILLVHAFYSTWIVLLVHIRGFIVAAKLDLLSL